MPKFSNLRCRPLFVTTAEGRALRLLHDLVPLEAFENYRDFGWLEFRTEFDHPHYGEHWPVWFRTDGQTVYFHQGEWRGTDWEVWGSADQDDNWNNWGARCIVLRTDNLPNPDRVIAYYLALTSDPHRGMTIMNGQPW